MFKIKNRLWFMYTKITNYIKRVCTRLLNLRDSIRIIEIALFTFSAQIC